MRRRPTDGAARRQRRLRPRRHLMSRRWCDARATCHNAAHADRHQFERPGLRGASTAPRPTPVSRWRLRGASMPPPGMLRPDAATLTSVAAQLEDALDGAEAQPATRAGDAAALELRRYANAARLLLEIDPAGHAPPDNAAFVRTSRTPWASARCRTLPGLGRASAALVVGDDRAGRRAPAGRVRQDISQDQHSKYFAVGHAGRRPGRTHTFPLDGEYELQVKLHVHQPRHDARAAGAPVRDHIDGARAGAGRPRDLDAAFEAPTDAGDAIDKRVSTRLKIAAGPRTCRLPSPRRCSTRCGCARS